VFCFPKSRINENGGNFHSGLLLLLGDISLSQTCSKLQNDSIGDSEVDDRLEKKYILLTL